jgi:hypothetical protein
MRWRLRLLGQAEAGGRQYSSRIHAEHHLHATGCLRVVAAHYKASVVSAATASRDCMSVFFFLSSSIHFYVKRELGEQK